MQSNSLSVVLFLVGLGAELILAGISQAGIKHRLLTRSLLGVGIILIIGGGLWPWIENIYPALVQVATRRLAENPVSWFVAIMFGLVLVLLRTPSSRMGTPTVGAEPGKEIIGPVGHTNVDYARLTHVKDLILSHVEPMVTHFVRIFYSLYNMDLGASGDCGHFVIEAIKNGIQTRLDSVVSIARDGSNSVIGGVLEDTFVNLMQSYSVAQDYLPKMVKMTNIDPNRFGIVREWLDLDNRCGDAIRSAVVSGTLSSERTKGLDRLTASARRFDASSLSASVVRGVLGPPSPIEIALIERKKERSMVVMDIQAIQFDRNGPSELYIDIFLRNTGPPATVTSWSLSVYRGEEIILAGMRPRFVPPGRVTFVASGPPKTEILDRDPIPEGGTVTGRLGFTFSKMVAEDVVGEGGLRFRVLADDVYEKRLDASFIRSNA